MAFNLILPPVTRGHQSAADILIESSADVLSGIVVITYANNLDLRSAAVNEQLDARKDTSKIVN